MDLFTLALRGFGGASALLALCLWNALPALASRAPQSPFSLTPRLERHAALKSWMARGAEARKMLLYVSDDASGSVYVYDYPSGVPEGALTGFSLPYGQCVDKKGNVWITDERAGTVQEFAHGGTSPIVTLTTNGFPIGCSIDATTGNLAVANRATGGGPGDIQVWTKPSRKPASYSNPGAGAYTLFAPAYDPQGNLYFEAQSETGTIGTFELPAGGMGFGSVGYTNLLGTGQLFGGGGILWDGTYLVVTDIDYMYEGITSLSQVVESPSGALSAVSGTLLTDTCFPSVPGGNSSAWPFVVGNKNTPKNSDQATVVIGANALCGGRFDFWSYPSGGNPNLLLGNAPALPVAEAVSIGSR